MLRRRWIIVLGLMLLGVFARPAQAHPIIVSAEPAADAQLAASPSRVRVVFNEPLEALSALQLYDAQGNLLAEGGRTADDSAVLELTPPLLMPGVYTVIVRVVGSDGHLVSSNYAFRVGTAEDAVPGNEQAARPLSPTIVQGTGEPPLLLAAFLRGLMLFGALSVVGGWVFRGAMLAPALATASEATTSAAWRRWRIGMLGGLAVLFGATVMFALLHTFHVAERLDGTSLQMVLLNTRLGLALVQRLWLAFLLAALLFGTGALTIWHRWLALALCAVLLATFAFSGHAATQSAPALPIFADWLHLGATALWVGGLVQFVLVLPALRAAKPSERVAVLACMIERFSPLALASVVVLAATGVYAALLHLQAWSALWTTRYGQILLAKVILFGALVLLGAYNMIVVRPRFRAWATRTAEALLVQRWQRRFMRSVRSEVVLALLVIMAAGALTSLAPAPVQTNVASAARTIPSVPFDQTQHVDDLHVRLQVTPASISRNQFQVTVTDAAAQPVEAQLVRLEIDMIDMDMGETQLELAPSGPGEYSATASPLSMVGEWRIAVLVRRADADDVRAVFAVPVGQ